MSSSDDPNLGSIVAGRYRVDALLGSGEMARVYLAEQLSMGRPVALKLLRPEIAREPDAVLRFRREVEAVTRLRSPHAISFYDFGQSDDTLFIAMERLDGEPLRARLERDPVLAPDLVLHIVTETCECLAEAHGAGIIHRDLKPENVFLCTPLAAGRPVHVKVVDFGLAKILEGTRLDGITAKNSTVGTPAYLAPERVTSGMKDDERADLYALGVMVFEMLTGQRPYDSPNLIQMLRLHRDAPVPSARALRPELPAMVDAFLRQAMAKDATARFGSAEAFARALAGALES